MLRRLSTFIFLIWLLAWLMTMAAYVRSKFRWDVITLVTSGGHCIILASVDDELELTEISHWTGPPQFQWSTAAACSAYSVLSSEDQLRGPDFALTFVTPERRAAWRHFGIAEGPSQMVYYTTGVDIGPPDHYWLGNKNYDDTPRYVGVNYLRGWVPDWSIPVAFSLVPCVWLLTAGRRCWRRLSRLRRGLCTQCGYDLRQSPNRCPECGSSITIG